MDEGRLAIGHLLFRVARRLRWEMDEALSSFGFTVVQFLVLAYLDRHGGRGRQRDLRDFLRVEAPSLTGLLQRMERDGLIRRSRESMDRRNREIVITDRGRSLRLAMAEAVEGRSGEIFARLGEEELGGLRRGLTALGRELGLEDGGD